MYTQIVLIAMRIFSSYVINLMVLSKRNKISSNAFTWRREIGRGEVADQVTVWPWREQTCIHIYIYIYIDR
jgi:hypothetical protein